jgi:citrate synthase
LGDRHRFEEFIAGEGIFIIPDTDPRVELVKRTCTRLVQALQDDSPVMCAAESTGDVLRKMEKMKRAVPSARTEALTMLPFLPEVRPLFRFSTDG